MKYKYTNLGQNIPIRCNKYILEKYTSIINISLNPLNKLFLKDSPPRILFIIVIYSCLVLKTKI